jgi:hypothetical protein
MAETFTLDKASHLLSDWLLRKPDEVKAQKAAVDNYGSYFAPANLGNITQDGFKDFLQFKNNKHWSGIHRQPEIYADMERLRDCLKILLDESKPIESRLDRIIPKNDPPFIKGLSRAVLTPILMCVYPDKYAVYNRISDAGLEMLGRNPINASDSFAKRYTALNKACHEISAEIQQPLYLIDSMFSLMVHGVESPLDGPAAGPSGHVIVSKPAPKKSKTKTAEDMRSAVQKWMAEVLEQHQFEIARGGTGTAASRLEERLNKNAGFWLDSGENQKPIRWLFHVVSSTEGPKAVWPSQPTYRYMGIVGASNRKCVLTYRLVPLFKIAEGKFEVNLGWEWLIWIALNHPLRSALGNSAPVKNLSFEKEEVFVAGQHFPVVAGGIIGLCNPDEQVVYEGFKEPIRYGDITRELVTLVSKLGTTEQPDAKFITSAVPPTEGPKA